MLSSSKKKEIGEDKKIDVLVQAITSLIGIVKELQIKMDNFKKEMESLI